MTGVNIWGLGRRERRVEQGVLVEMDRVGSTMDAARTLLRNGRTDVAGVKADHQSAGRGRQGGAWLAPPGACLLVTYVLPARGMEQFARNLPFAAGVAVAEAVAMLTEVPVKLKWPNDVMASGRKLAGILVETSVPHDSPSTPRALYLVGIGLNVNVDQFPAELAEIATSLEIETGLLFDIGDVEEEVRRHLFEAAYLPWTEILARWRALDDTLGRRYRTPDGTEGVAIGITDEGLLRLDTAQGAVDVLAATST